MDTATGGCDGSRIIPCDAAVWSLSAESGRDFLNITNTDFMQVLVFKTNLTDTHCIRQVEPYLEAHPHIHRWNVDLHDCDNILRIETEQLKGNDVENIIAKAGYYCEEL
jgi:hypothetical protein